MDPVIFTITVRIIHQWAEGLPKALGITTDGILPQALFLMDPMQPQ